MPTQELSPLQAMVYLTMAVNGMWRGLHCGRKNRVLFHSPAGHFGKELKKNEKVFRLKGENQWL